MKHTTLVKARPAVHVPGLYHFEKRNMVIRAASAKEAKRFCRLLQEPTGEDSHDPRHWPRLVGVVRFEPSRPAAIPLYVAPPGGSYWTDYDGYRVAAEAEAAALKLLRLGWPVQLYVVQCAWDPLR